MEKKFLSFFFVVYHFFCERKSLPNVTVSFYQQLIADFFEHILYVFFVEGIRPKYIIKMLSVIWTIDREISQVVSGFLHQSVTRWLMLIHDFVCNNVLFFLTLSRVAFVFERVDTQMLCLHVPSLLPHPFADMDTSSVTQAAALAGVGLLYQVTHLIRTDTGGRVGV